METELKNIATDLAYKLGAVLTITTVMAYSVDFKLFLNPFIGIGFGIFIILFGVYSIYQSKKQNSGIISFGEAFKSYFRTIAIGYLIYWIWTFILLNLINTDTGEDISTLTNDYSLSNFLDSYCIRIIQYSFIGIIISLIFSQNKKEE